MDARNHNLDPLKADFYLCLARAFMTPLDPAMWQAMRDDLADELEELAGEIGYDCTAEIEEYRRRIRHVTDAGSLLAIYSRLFLQPPRAVHINAGVYLDGSLNGHSVAAMETCYHACGIDRAADFLDLADHVAVQLECVSYLYAQAPGQPSLDRTGPIPHSAGAFIGHFPLRWTEPLCQDLLLAERELEMPDEPYLPLARILQTAIQADADTVPRLDSAHQRQERALALARHKQAEKGIGAADLDVIRRRLEARGLAADHLAVDPGLRDAFHGWQRMVPPTPRGK